MTLLGQVLDTRSTRNAIEAENPLRPLTDTTLLQALGIDASWSGKNVNEITALGMSAVWRAVQVTTAVPAALPFHVYTKDGDSRKRSTSTVATLIDDPHPDMTPFEFWQTVFMHRKLWGNAYIRKLRNELGQIRELWPIHPGRVKVGRESETGRKVYLIDGDTDNPLSDREILHLPGIGYDGICGVSPVRAARQSIGLGLAAEEYGAKLFGNGALATGILQTEQRLTPKQADQLADRWKSKRTGMDSAHSTIVLDKGANFHQLSIPPGDAQFLESRRFQIVEVCRWFGLPPFLMFETEKSTSWGTGLEQQALGWVKFDLGSDLVAVEQRVTKHVVASDEASTRAARVAQKPDYAHFSIDGLLRGDSAARASFYRTLWNLGVLSTNEVRAYEELEPVEGGDVRYRPLNMGELGTTDAETNAVGEDGPNDDAAPVGDADVARSVTEMVQKVYLGIDKVVTADEARALLNRAGADLDGNFAPSEHESASARALNAPVPDLNASVPDLNAPVPDLEENHA